MNLQITSTFLSRWSVCYRVPTWGPSVYRGCWSRVPQTHFWLVGGSGLWVKINTDILILIAGAQWDSCRHTGVSYYAANLSRSTCKVHRVRESGGVSEAWQLYLLTSSQACPVFMVHCSRLDCLGVWPENSWLFFSVCWLACSVSGVEQEFQVKLFMMDKRQMIYTETTWGLYTYRVWKVELLMTCLTSKCLVNLNP